MKNKLLLTTALASLALGTSAYAETKITGGMTLTYAGIKNATSTALSQNGFGREVQLDIRNSGSLNNGWKYAAGFSLEQDGTETGFDGGEQNFIDFINGDTTISFGMDHMPNLSGTAVPRAGKMLATATAGVGSGLTSASSTGLLYLNDPLDTTYTSFGVGIMQKVSTGVVSVNYIPSVDDQGTRDTGGGDLTQGNAAWEATYNGTISGLGVKLGYKRLDKDPSNSVVAAGNGKAYQVGLSYGVGALKMGIQRNDVKPGTAANTDYTTDEYGIAYAINDNLTASISRAKTKSDSSSITSDENITELSVGYNLGAVAVVVQYADVENAGGVNAKDGDKIALRLSTAF